MRHSLKFAFLHVFAAISDHQEVLKADAFQRTGAIIPCKYSMGLFSWSFLWLVTQTVLVTSEVCMDMSHYRECS